MKDRFDDYERMSMREFYSAAVNDAESPLEANKIYSNYKLVEAIDQFNKSTQKFNRRQCWFNWVLIALTLALVFLTFKLI